MLRAFPTGMYSGPWKRIAVVSINIFAMIVRYGRGHDWRSLSDPDCSEQFLDLPGLDLSARESSDRHMGVPFEWHVLRRTWCRRRYGGVKLAVASAI